MPFGTKGPLKALNIILVSIPFVNFVGLPLTVAQGWGKDYWTIFIKT